MVFAWGTERLVVNLIRKLAGTWEDAAQNVWELNTYPAFRSAEISFPQRISHALYQVREARNETKTLFSQHWMLHLAPDGSLVDAISKRLPLLSVPYCSIQCTGVQVESCLLAQHHCFKHNLTESAFTSFHEANTPITCAHEPSNG